jgi:hypothetical protein
MKSIFDVRDGEPIESVYVPDTPLVVRWLFDSKAGLVDFEVAFGSNVYDEYSAPAREFMKGKPMNAESTHALGHFLVALMARFRAEIAARPESVPP